jgi:hypothetical protein
MTTQTNKNIEKMSKTKHSTDKSVYESEEVGHVLCFQNFDEDSSTYYFVTSGQSEVFGLLEGMCSFDINDCKYSISGQVHVKDFATFVNIDSDLHPKNKYFYKIHVNKLDKELIDRIQHIFKLAWTQYLENELIILLAYGMPELFNDLKKMYISKTSIISKTK